VYSEAPAISSRKNYRAVELAFEQYSNDVGIDMDELDLLFWCAQTGHILK
jgi:thermostable 8-oxoguanine DNA glycosylase